MADGVLYNRPDAVKERSPKVRQINLCFSIKSLHGHPRTRINSASPAPDALSTQLLYRPLPKLDSQRIEARAQVNYYQLHYTRLICLFIVLKHTSFNSVPYNETFLKITVGIEKPTGDKYDGI